MADAILKRFALAGKVAAITGGGGDLCGAMAQALGAMGVAVAVLDIDPAKADDRARAIVAAGGQAAAWRCDVLDPAQLQDCYSAISRRWHAPDFLVNGAGGNDPRGTTAESFHEGGQAPADRGQSFFDLSREGFQRVFDLNFMGTFLATQVFAAGMTARGAGAIVNISSMSAFTPLTKVAAYSAAKAAVSNFTRWLAVHLAHSGVRVNALAPGFFMTEQLKFLHLDRETGELLPRARAVIAHTPMGRYGDPDDLIGPLVWLLSEASRFVTGVVVPVDGGFSSFTI
jgi:NAD(P)-dependent dehydrogenase (short-subunit alcohol dehydrogenase family)